MANKKGKRHRHSDSSKDESDDSSSASDSSEEDSPVETLRKKSKSSRKRKGSDKKKSKKSKKSKKEVSLSEGDMICEEDYFRKSMEFRSWLTTEKQIYFSDLTSAKSRNLFKKFVKKWNNLLLPKQYYDGVSTSSIKQSSHKWKLSNVDSAQLGSVKDSVSSWTTGSSPSEQFPTSRHPGTKDTPIMPPPTKDHTIGPSIGPSIIGPSIIGPSIIGPSIIGPSIGPSIPSMIGPLPEGYQPSAGTEADEDEKRKMYKHEVKEFRKHHNMVMDELLPKATGKEARIEKKKLEREKKRQRGASPELSETFLMGSSGRGIKERIHYQQQQRVVKVSQAKERLIEYQAKERDKAVAILEMARASKKEGSLWK